MADFEVKGVQETIVNLQKTGLDLVTAAKVGLYRVGQQIMADSKSRYVPVDTGVLRASGYVEPPTQSGNVVTVTLGYGGAAQAYATIQHEDLSLHHTVGQAKYLEIPARLHMGGAAAAMVPDIQKAIDRSGTAIDFSGTVPQTLYYYPTAGGGRRLGGHE